MMIPDLLVVGGGVVGLAIAEQAQRNGLRTVIIDKGPVGGESSWAGAGMLTSRPKARNDSGHPDYHDLTIYSTGLYKNWTDRLLDETGIDSGYRVCGAIELVLKGIPPRDDIDFTGWAAASNARGVRAQVLTASDAAELEPALCRNIEAAIEFPDEAQVRSPRLNRALACSFEKNGGIVKTGAKVADINISGSRADGVNLSDGEFVPAGRVLISSGAWTAQLPSLVKVAARTAKIHPVRGQLLCYKTDPGLCKRLLTSSGHYIVPREDGIVLVGATQENAGFEKVTTPEGTCELEEFAARIVPFLSKLKPVQSWAGLRPGLKGKHPILGPVKEIEGLFVAAGHFRNGFTLAPATAELTTAIILGRKPAISVEFWYP